MAFFRNGAACVFSLSPRLCRHQKPYIFLLTEKQNKLLSRSVPVFSVCAVINFFGMLLCFFFEVARKTPHEDLTFILPVSIAGIIFYIYFFLFLWMKVGSLPFDAMRQGVHSFHVDKFTSTFLYIGCLATLLTPLSCLIRLRELSFLQDEEDIFTKIVKIALLMGAFLMIYYCVFMIKNIQSENRS